MRKIQTDPLPINSGRNWRFADKLAYIIGPIGPIMRPFSQVRAFLVLALIVVSLFGLLGRVAFLETKGRQETLSKAQRQQHMTETLVARRGTIFDRNGFVLACTTQQRTVFVDPKFMREQIAIEDKTTFDKAL
ncbi:MAG TPA: hypothetical protein VG722_01620, partial [Tepidisphaeraceae bacterium]|nr:hypothetical protein [Tepidisphaeraceae bacterium]